jgi:hypothetical protein
MCSSSRKGRSSQLRKNRTETKQVRNGINTKIGEKKNKNRKICKFRLCSAGNGFCLAVLQFFFFSSISLLRKQQLSVHTNALEPLYNCDVDFTDQ